MICCVTFVLQLYKCLVLAYIMMFFALLSITKEKDLPIYLSIAAIIITFIINLFDLGHVYAPLSDILPHDEVKLNQIIPTFEFYSKLTILPMLIAFTNMAIFLYFQNITYGMLWLVLAGLEIINGVVHLCLLDYLQGLKNDCTLNSII